MSRALMWFRNDLRLTDNSAFAAACAASATGCVAHDLSAPGADASVAWRGASLRALDAALRARGGSVGLLEGGIAGLVRIAAESQFDSVHCSRDWTPRGLSEETAARDELARIGVRLEVHGGAYAVEPDELRAGSGEAFRVFTPFFRAWLRRIEHTEPLQAAPREQRFVAVGRALPDARPDTRLRGGVWEPGEAGAHRRLTRFLADALSLYTSERDIPAERATSELSPHLAFGEIAPQRVISAVRSSMGPTEDIEKFLAEMAWREFAAAVLFAHPRTERQPLRSDFERMPWSDDADGLAAWSEGRTGYPIVDAGMRQLAATGWMHNRVRLVVGSFLTKDLLIAWQMGEAAFRARLFDFDTASNTFNWQWVSGSGADAAPYFRVFNPTLQGEKFDAEGAYVRAWVPELAQMPARWIHRPWEAPVETLHEAGVRLGSTYPRPIIDHREARERALAAFASLKG